MIYNKILVPTDFSLASHAAIACAVQLAQPSHTQLCVLHVTTGLDHANSPSQNGSHVKSDGERHALAIKNLCDVIEQLISPSIRSYPLLKFGEAARMIVRSVAEEGVELIVMTRHGAGGADSVDLGAVAIEVLRTAGCPVLLLDPMSYGRRDGASAAAGDPAPVFAAHLRPALQLTSEKMLYLDGD